jgi:hypothetical protein
MRWVNFILIDLRGGFNKLLDRDISISILAIEVAFRIRRVFHVKRINRFIGSFISRIIASVGLVNIYKAFVSLIKELLYGMNITFFIRPRSRMNRTSFISRFYINPFNNKCNGVITFSLQNIFSLSGARSCVN